MMGWWRNAYEGQKVVCVDIDVLGLLYVGRTYTVSAIRACNNFRDVETNTMDRDGVGFRVSEVSVPEGDMWFHHRRFRPVQPKSTETGMAILKRILNGAPVREDA